MIDSIKGLRLADVPGYAESNYWFYCLQIEEIEYEQGLDELMVILSEHSIETRLVWRLNHLQKPYKSYQNYQIEIAYELQKKTLHIPCSINLKESQIAKVLNVLSKNKVCTSGKN